MYHVPVISVLNLSAVRSLQKVVHGESSPECRSPIDMASFGLFSRPCLVRSRSLALINTLTFGMYSMSVFSYPEWF